MLIQGWLLTDLFAAVVTIRQAILIPCILLFCVIGGHIYHNNLGDVELALIAGIFGYVFRKLKFPLAPLVIAYIITPMAERSFKQALLISGGDYTVFFTKPISLFFILLAAVILILSVWKQPKVSGE